MEEEGYGDDIEADELKMMDAEDFSDNIFKDFKVKFLKDLYIRSQKQFELFRTMLNAISYD